ncbi:hypothetical protein MKX01_015808 [Papaver californicum]|nr:hypothetical protein MKX01_015808 [Papaver californicum]
MEFSIINRARYPVSSDQHPLLTASPHHLVFNIEYYHSFGTYNSLSDFVSSQYSAETSRLFATHMPYHSLPESLKRGTNKQLLVSMELLKIRGPNITIPFPIEKAFDFFCNGISLFTRLENPEKVLFLKYEDLKKEPKSHFKRLAEFLGFPFSVEEERGLVIEHILKLSNGSVNGLGFENKIFFRKGEVADWKNQLTSSMVQRIDGLFEEKLRGSGLVFES